MKFPDIQVAGSGQLYARFHTTQGVIVASLAEKEAPNTVKNFVGLATGTQDWSDPIDGSKNSGKPLYSGVKFHRVIPGFMIQCGDPASRHDSATNRWGMGGPGYRFDDEFHASLKHDTTGILSMANSGPGTNGSQFFITEGPTPHLDRRHSVFGKVVAGIDVVKKIANVPRNRQDRPDQAQVLEKVEIFRSETVPTA
ncbi:MAG TPA: peptidylprolyl isomerase [Polyangiaceae bacterium]|nr:peptidylprolyl isomerase [Polyangiaceae bacterium]